MKPRLCVMASGGGRSLENLCEAIQAESLHAEVALVVIDKESAGAKARAERWSIPVALVAKTKGEDAAAYSKRLFAAVDGHGVIDLVVLAGFLKLIKIPPAWQGRVINIHPSLLPAFGGQGYYGHHVHAAVLAHGVEVTGCTVHYVDDEYDHGRVLLQRWIAVPPNVDADQLAELVFEEEKLALPAAIARHFERRA